MNSPVKRSALQRLRTHFQANGLGGGTWLALRFLYCRIYGLRFRTCGSFFIRGSFYIRGNRHISIGSLRAGDRIRIEAVERHGDQDFQPSITIGHGVCFTDDIHIGCTHRIELRDGVLLGSHVYITDHDHGIYAGDHPQSPADQLPSQRPLTGDGTVILEENVHVGEYVTILKNVRIGKGSVIGAHSNVTSDIPPYTIAVGNPARPIKRFSQDSLRWVKWNQTS
jgi:lipopolysaccharide O-acetyltransferase